MAADVVIDGVTYVPTGEPALTIGVGVTTRNRPEVLAQSRAAWRRFLPAGAKLVLVDDASDTPVDGADFRFDVRAGVAAANNKCLELLDGCDHIFLFDDDCWPTADGWWEPYVQGREPHYQFQFDAPKHWRIHELGRDGETRWVDRSRGAMLYVDRVVLDVVGGESLAFGRYGGEHENWSSRIHAAGLTSHPFQDVLDPKLRCLDEQGVASSTDWRADMAWRYVDADRLDAFQGYTSRPIPVLVPRRPDYGHRDKLWEFLSSTYWDDLQFQIVEGLQLDGPFNRSAAINLAARIAGNWDIAVIADSDTWVPPAQLKKAIHTCRESRVLTSALTEVHELSSASTAEILRTKDRTRGKDARVRKSESETQSSALVVPRELFEEVQGFDEFYKGWGCEDEAFWRACSVVGGTPKRVTGPAYHLWHPTASAADRAKRQSDPIYQANYKRLKQMRQIGSAPRMRKFLGGVE